MILPLTTKGKYLFYYTLTTITDAAGIYLVVTTYYKDEKCSKFTGREPLIYNFTDREEAENFYTEMSDNLYKDYKKEFEK